MLRKIAYIVARLAAAFIMGQTLFFKFTGSAESIYIFSTVGMEPWGRWMVGIFELIAAILLIIPTTAWAGGIIAIGLMAGAIGMHLTILGIEVMGDKGQLFYYALIVFLCGLYVVFNNREKILKRSFTQNFKKAMKKLIWILAFVISACGGSNTTNSSSTEGSQIPGGAIIQDYVSVSGLQKAIVKKGQVIVGEGDFLNGQYHGSWTSYTTDGKVQSITTYLNGKKQGVQLLFDNVGYVETKASYHNDQLSGEYLVYKRRTIVERKNYTNGVLNGLQQKYYVDGTVMEESNYVDGKIDGVARWYDQEGNLKIEYEYDMGKLVEK